MTVAVQELTARARLEQAATRLGVDLSVAQVDALFAYLDLIQKWTKVYNLTAVRDPAEMLTHHLLDSLTVVAPLRRQLSLQSSGQPAGQTTGPLATQTGSPPGIIPVRLLDVGSGAGLPGVVIAICCPELRVDCVDTVGKKAAFINQVAVTLRLPNLHGLHARVESLTEKYQVISSRAFASLADFTTWSAAALAGEGVWLAMKGKHPADELAALPSSVEVFHVEQLNVPGLDAERCIVWMRRKSSS